MLSKEDMAIRLARLEWTIDDIIRDCQNITKEQTGQALTELQKDVKVLLADHKAPRPREVKKSDSSTQDGKAPEQTSIPTDSKSDS